MKITYKNSQFLTGLIEDLEENFPNSIPINTPISIEDVRRLQGHQEAIQYIRNLLDTGEDDTQ